MLSMKMNDKSGKESGFIGCLFFICLFLLFYIFSNYIVTQGDDFAFRAGLQERGGILGWMVFFAQNWGGRIIPQGFLAILLQAPDWVFNLVNSFMWIILLLYADKDFNPHHVIRREAFIIVLIFAVFLIIPQSVLIAPAMRKAAIVIYLWCFSMTLVTFYPFIAQIEGLRITKFDVIAGLIASVYASGYEQTGELLIGGLSIFVLVLLIRKQKIPFSLWIIYIIGSTLTLLFLSAPGNVVRSKAETLGWFQKYDMFSPVDKFLMGVNYAIGHTESQAPVLLAALTILVFVFALHQKKRNALFLLISFSLMTYFGLNYVNQIAWSFDGSTTLISKIFYLIPIDTTDFGISFWQIVKECLNVFMIVLLGLALSSCNADHFNASVFVLYFGAFATMWAMGFSPTIYASMDRPLFIGFFCLILCAFNMLFITYKQKAL